MSESIECIESKELPSLTSENIYTISPEVICKVFKEAKCEPSDPVVNRFYFAFKYNETPMESIRDQALMIKLWIASYNAIRTVQALAEYAKNSVEICKLLGTRELEYIVKLDAAKANFLAPAIMYTHGLICKSIPDANITPGAIVSAVYHAPTQILSSMLARMPRETRSNRAVLRVLMKAAVSYRGLDLLKLINENRLYSDHLLQLAAQSESICVESIEYILYEIGYDTKIDYFVGEAERASNTHVLDILKVYKSPM